MSQKPISNVIQPVSNAIRPVGSAIQAVGTAIRTVGSAIKPAGTAPKPKPAAREKLGPAVEVLAEGMRINEILVSRPDVVAYIEGIAPDKREVALVHAIEVGITEILVRRRRALGH
jgi:hypothetical protein